MVKTKLVKVLNYTYLRNKYGDKDGVYIVMVKKLRVSDGTIYKTLFAWGQFGNMLNWKVSYYHNKEEALDAAREKIKQKKSMWKKYKEKSYEHYLDELEDSGKLDNNLYEDIYKLLWE